jgi:N-acetylglucosamine kinase-like BadF-type ATPase
MTGVLLAVDGGGSKTDVVVLALDGTVLAQGTFNSARQLEALVATGEAREPELVHA